MSYFLSLPYFRLVFSYKISIKYSVYWANVYAVLVSVNLLTQQYEIHTPTLNGDIFHKTSFPFIRTT